MRLIENLNPSMAALEALIIVIEGSVGTIGYQMDGSARLRVVRSVVELVVSKPATRKEVC